MLRSILVLLVVALGALPADADGAKAPKLAVASRFGQAWYPGILAAATKIPVTDFRDEIYWQRIEAPDGSFRFDQSMTNYPKMIGADGGTVSLLLGGGYPSYDQGNTPYSARGVAAFGRMAAAAVTRFPQITSVEVGNEFNSQDFITGPVRETGLKARAARYVALLKSTYRQVKAIRPDVRVLGGAALGIPGGYLGTVFSLGAARVMDALAIHPYTTSDEQLARQIAVLRRLTAVANLPIEITEFGDPDPATAPAHLLKGYCQAALAGVTRLVWYPLAARADGMVPLLDRQGGLTDVGRAFRFAQTHLAQKHVTDAAPDPFTYGCLFGDNTLVIWGERRGVTVADGIQVFSATGRNLAADNLHLSMATPLVIKAAVPIVLNGNVKLEPQRILADTLHQFEYPQANKALAARDPFIRLARHAATDTPMVTNLGQTGPGTLWTPSLADPQDGYIRLTAEFLRPDGTADNPVEVVHQYDAVKAEFIDIAARWAVRPDDGDGVRVTVTLNGRILADRVVTGPFGFRRTGLWLKKGDRLEFIVGPNGNARGDITDYRITLRRAVENR